MVPRCHPLSSFSSSVSMPLCRRTHELSGIASPLPLTTALDGKADNEKLAHKGFGVVLARWRQRRLRRSNACPRPTATATPAPTSDCRCSNSRPAALPAATPAPAPCRRPKAKRNERKTEEKEGRRERGWHVVPTHVSVIESQIFFVCPTYMF